MRAEFAYEEAQKYLRQRNWLALVAGGLAVTTLFGVGAAATRDREVVLVPVTSERLSLSSAGPDAHYLELVTRDTALMLLNRSPQGLDYWMAEILKLADPAAHGRLKAELVKIVDEQRGSDISQAFVIRKMEVDPGRPHFDRHRHAQDLRRRAGDRQQRSQLPVPLEPATASPWGSAGFEQLQDQSQKD
jgi:conjugal transfer pilus assembly protein TraE